MSEDNTNETQSKQLNNSDRYGSMQFLFDNHSSNESVIQRQIEEDYFRKFDTESKTFHLKDVIPFMTEGAQVIIKDDISECFEPLSTVPWRKNAIGFTCWTLSIILRYFVLFPIRLFILMLGTSIFFSCNFVLLLLTRDRSITRVHYNKKLLKFYSRIFTFSWTTAIKYHGKLPEHTPNQIYVANHTSMIDYIILLQSEAFAVLGQKHPGWVGWFQDTILNKMIGGVWFERDLPNDRKRSADLIKDYISTNEHYKNRLLIFPEGTCVNSKYCIQFKRGAFNLGADICPIAIKYSENFTDAFWNSRKKSFARHLFDLMTSWALVCDIYYLEPQKRLPEETPEQFASRVKGLISKVANLKEKNWDGYLKYFRPSRRFVEYRQKKFAESLVKRLLDNKQKSIREK